MKLKVVLLFFILNTVFVSGTYSQTLDSQIIAEQFYSEVLKSLPENFQEYIQNIHVKITAKKLSKIPKGVCTSELKDRVIFGEFRNNNIIINSELIQRYFEKKNQELDCPHKSLSKLIKATMIHELAHIFDKGGRFSTTDEYASISFFEKTTYSHQSTESHDRTVSVVLENKNNKASRSPDVYEFKNIRENFAVNVEHFLLDNSYTCRRPLKANYFSKIFNHVPQRDCDFKNTIQITSFDSIKEINIHPDRVKSISYLFAGAGADVESKFGHAQILLNICDNKQCELTQKYVLSFAADTPSQFTIVGGVVGDYKSKMLVMPFLENRMQYNVLELRDITEYPLILSEVQKRRFLSIILSNFWEYNGHYKFFTNNCASELFELFKYAIDDEDLYKIKINTPKAIVDALLFAHVIDTQNIGHFYGDRVLKNQLDRLDIDIKVKEFISLRPHDRRSYFNKITSDSDIFTFILAETLSRQYWTKRIYNQLIKKDLNDSELSQRVEGIKRILQDFNDSEKGYGIPIQSSDSLLNVKSVNKKLKDEIREIQKIINDSNDEFKDIFQGIKDNQRDLNQLLLKAEAR